MRWLLLRSQVRTILSQWGFPGGVGKPDARWRFRVRLRWVSLASARSSGLNLTTSGYGGASGCPCEAYHDLRAAA